MAILTGLLLALPGGLAVLAGLTGMHRVRRLRRNGVATWAVAVPPPPGDQRSAESAGPARGQLLQYTLADGRTLEHAAHPPALRSAPLQPGQKVLVWYDPDDPADVLVYGRWGRSADRAFVAAGSVFIAIGAALTALGR
jgi:Protein of unknown function (DUF3592)